MTDTTEPMKSQTTRETDAIGSPMAVDLAGLVLRNPVMLAAGTAGYLDEMGEVLSLDAVGAVVTKSITRHPREGNPTWRIRPTRAGMLNAIGLANIGIEAFQEHIVPRIASVPTTVVGSIAGFSIEDYVTVAAIMDDTQQIRAVELNVSCPNVHGGTEFGADEKALRALVAAVRPVLTHTMLCVKLSPVAVGAVTVEDLARAAIEGLGTTGGPNKSTGADMICVSNTLPAMQIDVHTRKPLLANTTGGLSGPALHPVVVRLIHLLRKGVCGATHTPIIGAGGVLRWQDAAQFIVAGASAVQIGTGLFVNPKIPQRVARGLDRWRESLGAHTIQELVGTLQVD